MATFFKKRMVLFFWVQRDLWWATFALHSSFLPFAGPPSATPSLGVPLENRDLITGSRSVHITQQATRKDVTAKEAVAALSPRPLKSTDNGSDPNDVNCSYRLRNLYSNPDECYSMWESQQTILFFTGQLCVFTLIAGRLRVIIIVDPRHHQTGCS